MFMLINTKIVIMFMSMAYHVSMQNAAVDVGKNVAVFMRMALPHRVANH